MRTKSTIFLLIILIIIIGTYLIVVDREERSPLLDSWKQYLKLKKDLRFNLEWISLGPS